ncbi:hypothetical protein Dimus_025102 [Dionaea muscipula]
MSKGYGRIRVPPDSGQPLAGDGQSITGVSRNRLWQITCANQQPKPAGEATAPPLPPTSPSFFLAEGRPTLSGAAARRRRQPAPTTGRWRHHDPLPTTTTMATSRGGQNTKFPRIQTPRKSPQISRFQQHIRRLGGLREIWAYRARSVLRPPDLIQPETSPSSSVLLASSTHGCCFCSSPVAASLSPAWPLHRRRKQRSRKKGRGREKIGGRGG